MAKLILKKKLLFPLMYLFPMQWYKWFGYSYTLLQTAFHIKEFVSHLYQQVFLFCDFTCYETYVHVNDYFNKAEWRM